MSQENQGKFKVSNGSGVHRMQTDFLTNQPVEPGVEMPQNTYEKTKPTQIPNSRNSQDIISEE